VNEQGKVVGAIVCKMENSKSSSNRTETVRRGYIAMLAVDKTQRRIKIGKYFPEKLLNILHAEEL
jgi:ribosomal protein S18 acetylase RimI-like enzyme